MSEARKITLSARLLICSHKIRKLIVEVKELEESSFNFIEKNNQIKIIREEITKLGIEIDNLKKEVTLLGCYNTN